LAGARLLPAAPFLFAALLAGCILAVDSEQARICRTALPALEDLGGGRIVIARLRPWRAPDGLRIDYRIERPDGVSLDRFAVCAFAARGLAAGKSELTGLVTASGPVSGATLYFLKHYYIETPEGLAAAPFLDERIAAVAEIGPAPAYALQQALAAAPRAAIYALMAAGYALVYGLVGRINLAFGEIAAIGAAAFGLVAAGEAAGSSGIVPGLAAGLLAAMAAAAVHNLVLGEFALLRVPFVQASLIATIGGSILLLEYLRLVQGARPHWLPPVWSEPVPLARSDGFVVTTTPMSMAVALLAAAAALAIAASIRTTGYGRRWRAFADDPLAAALFGIDGRRLMRTTLALSGAAAGLAAALTAAEFGALGFADGFVLGLKSLAAAILGGIGSVPGALAGGLCIGLFESVWSAYAPIGYRDAALYAALVIALVLRPHGLFTSRS
jgi:branched-chain amino acid transport system permease protein